LFDQVPGFVKMAMGRNAFALRTIFLLLPVEAYVGSEAPATDADRLMLRAVGAQPVVLEEALATMLGMADGSAQAMTAAEAVQLVADLVPRAAAAHLRSATPTLAIRDPQLLATLLRLTAHEPATRPLPSYTPTHQVRGTASSRTEAG
jgi:hypothetical protein